MHDLLSAHQDLAKISDSELFGLADQISQTRKQFERDLAIESTAAIVEDQIDEEIALEIKRTSTPFVNTTRAVGARPLELLREVVDAELARAAE